MKLLVFSILYICFSLFIDYYILTDSVYFEFYSGKYSEARIYELMNFRKEWVWILYPIKLIVQLVILQIPAMILYLGLYLAKYEIGYKKVFDVVLTSEYIFFIPFVIKIFWFSYQPVTMETVRLFSPLSLFSLFDPELLQEWLYYPFKVLNLFEVGYWVLLAYLLAKHLNQAFDAMLKLVLTYYVSFLFCWIIFVMFISLGNS